MTQRQIEEARRAGKCEPYGELSCREMINACLAYGSINDFWETFEWRFGDKSYAEPYVKHLGLRRVKELVAEQEVDFAKAKLIRNVFTDDEGCSYNSIQWEDDVN